MGQRGYSLVEATLATMLTLTVAAVLFALLDSGLASFAVQPESADLQQRLRVAAGMLYEDLVMAGAGMSRGPARGPLSFFFAPLLPYRHGTTDADSPGSFKADVISVMFVPDTVAQTTIATGGPTEKSGTIGVNGDPGCPAADASCGFKAAMSVVLYDATGHYDRFTVVDAQSNALHLESTTSDLTYHAYMPGTTAISEIAHVVYSLRPDTRSGAYQLVSLEGGTGTEVPVVDHVVALAFEYYGDWRPPALTGKPLDDPAGPWTTYGPPPPSPTTQMPLGGYPAGENCTFVFDATSGMQVPRLAHLAADVTSGLVRLDAAMLGDGPWCPDPADPNRWDADLLRVRAIGVTVRVEAANAALRGPASILFARGGTSRDGKRWLPDQEIRFYVAPRNLAR